MGGRLDLVTLFDKTSTLFVKALFYYVSNALYVMCVYLCLVSYNTKQEQIVVV